jgi:hypothetical protein
MRFKARSTVVLPLPDEPMKAVISFSGMVRETSVTALNALYQIDTCCISKTVSAWVDCACRSAGVCLDGLTAAFSSGCSMALPMGHNGRTVQ